MHSSELAQTMSNKMTIDMESLVLYRLTPAGSARLMMSKTQNNVIFMLLQCHDITSTFIRHWLKEVCLLGQFMLVDI